MKGRLVTVIAAVAIACWGCGTGIKLTMHANGTVAYTDIEGGAWYVRTDDGQNLVGFVPESLRVVGQRVYVEYTLFTEGGSSLQFGTPVVFDVIEPGDGG